MTSILFLIRRLYRNKFKCNYLRNKTFFPNFQCNLWSRNQILNILKKKMTLLVDGFPKLQTLKDVVRQMSKDTRLRTSSTANMLEGRKHCRNVHDITFIILFITLREIGLENVSLSDTWNIRTVCKHVDCQWQPIQMQLSKKQKTFSEFLAIFLKSKSNSHHFLKEMAFIA